MRLRVTYADVAVGAKEAFTPSVTGATARSDVSLLKGDNIPMWANPCERYSVLLDGSMQIAPDNAVYALVSNEVSGEGNGGFNVPPVLTVTASGQYTSQGITLIFDIKANRYASAVNIVWYRDNTVLSTMDFAPDSADYFCANKVENYNKLVITFTKMNMPGNRLYLTGLVFGTVRTFERNELQNFTLLQEIEPVSETISINTVDFTLKKQNDVDFIFQEKQPVYTYFDDTLIQTTFITHYERNSDKTYDIQTEDWISILDDSPFDGGIYTAYIATELISDILSPLGAEFELSDELAAETVTGYIPICSCREALNQTAFALGAVVDTSYSDKVKIYRLSDTVKGMLDVSNTFMGQSTVFRDKLTELRLTSYSYSVGTESTTVYKAADSGSGNGITVEFSEPLHSLTITNGTILSSNANKAVINANADCVLTGKRYIKTQSVTTKRNPLVLAGDKENVAELKEFTLVNRANVDMLAEMAYNYYSARREIRERILSGNLRIGEKVTQEYGYMDDVVGRLVRMKYSISGTAKAAEVTIR